MRRKGALFLMAAACALLLWVCFLWARGMAGVEQIHVSYDRYLADGSAASDEISITSDHRLWLTISRGAFEPFNGQLVSGYHLRADQSGGRPRFRHDYSHYGRQASLFAEGAFLLSDGAAPTDERSMSGWGPVRWRDYRRSGNGEQYHRSVTVGVSHWLVAAVLLLMMVRGLSICSFAKAAVGNRKREPGSALAAQDPT